MLKENLARNTEEPVLISVSDPGEQGWEAWVSQIGFRGVSKEEADVLLWVDPSEREWTSIASDPRSVVVGKPEIIDKCKREKIAYVKDVSHGEAVKKQLELHAQAHMDNTLPAKGSGFTVPPALSSGIPEKKRHISLQRKLGRSHPDKNETEASDDGNKAYPEEARDRKEIVLALPTLGNDGRRLKHHLLEKSSGEYHVLEMAESFSSLMKITEQGFFEILLVHRDLPGLAINMVENLRQLRGKASESRIILIERDPDEYSAMYRPYLQDENIECHVIPKLPGHLLSILRGNGTTGVSKIEFEWNEETSSPNLPTAVTTTKVMSPALFASHSTGGGIGKSTIAQQMGFVFAKMGYKTIIIELDAEKPSLLRGTGAPEDCPGLSSWMPDDFESEETALAAIRRTSRQVKGLYVLPVGPVRETKADLPFHMEASDKACQQAETLFKAALKDFSVVIVDTNPNLLDPPVFKALEMAKRVFYIMEATKVYLDSAKTHLAATYKLGIDSSKYELIMNKRTADDPVKLRLISMTLEMPVSLEVPLDVEGYRLAADKGRPYKPKKGESPWDGFCERVLKEIGVSIVTVSEKKSIFNRFFAGLGKKKI